MAALDSIHRNVYGRCDGLYFRNDQLLPIRADIVEVLSVILMISTTELGRVRFNHPYLSSI